MQYLIFSVNNELFALRLAHIDRVIRVVKIAAAPLMSKALLGMINLLGVPLPVLSARALIDASPKEIELSDQLICMTFEGKKFALLVDRVEEIKEISQKAVVSAESLALKNPRFAQVIQEKDRFIFEFTLNAEVF